MVRNMPHCLKRKPITILQPASIYARANEPMLAAEIRVAHTFGIPLEAVGFDFSDRRSHWSFDFPFVKQTLLVNLHSCFPVVLIPSVDRHAQKRRNSWLEASAIKTPEERRLTADA